MDMKNQPIKDAVVTIHKIDEDGNFSFITIVKTGRNGTTKRILLEAPPVACSYDYEQLICPYAMYNIEVAKNKYDIEEFKGIQIFTNCHSTMSVALHFCHPHDPIRNTANFDDHKLYRQGESKCLKSL